MVLLRKFVVISFLLVSFLLPIQTLAAKHPSNVEDLIIYQNVPEADGTIRNNSIQLKALHIYADGHFTETKEGLSWSSSNKRVAKVDEEGHVTLTGEKGKAHIKVTNGIWTDKIAIHNNKEKKAEAKGEIVKRKGKRYQIVQQAVAGMSIEEKIGQMLMPDFRKWEGTDVTEMIPEIEQLVKRYHLGGVILFRENVVTTEQTTKLVADYQLAAEKYGMLITIDQEGGVVTRLQSGTDMPGNMALGATRSVSLSYQVGQAIGNELSALGINMNLAPTLDVNNNADNPVIGVRSFGEDPDLVSRLGIAYMKGQQDSGIAATAKHFPGHGDTSVDSHLGLPEVPHDRERLDKVELYPFQQAMIEKIDAIMTAHVTFPKIDPTKVKSKKDGSYISLPATLSYKVLTELIREEMGFEGVIITDALNMKAIADHFGSVEAVMRAVQAGTDIILMPVGLEEVAEGLRHAITTGEISEERIDESVKRILALKLKRGVIKEENPQAIEEKIAHAREVVGSDKHRKIEKEVADKAITLVKNDGVLPLRMQPEEEIVVVGDNYVEDLAETVAEHHENMKWIKATGPLSEMELEKLQHAKAVIVSTYTANVTSRATDHPQMQLVNQLVTTLDVPVIGVATRNPYDVMAYPEIDAYLTQYGFRKASFQATASTIFGKNIPVGKLPVTIHDEEGNLLYPFGHYLTYGQ